VAQEEDWVAAIVFAWRAMFQLSFQLQDSKSDGAWTLPLLHFS